MTKIYLPKTEYELFAQRVYDVLVENFSQTYFTGGTARDLILEKELKDFDIATEATPENVVLALHKHNIKTDNSAGNFGVVKALHNGFEVEITTFRSERYHGSRYPDVHWEQSPQTDSQRRDFTINALYLRPKTGEVLDFHGGLDDLKSKTIKFIGDAQTRVEEDPIRIIRAYRFTSELNGEMETTTKQVCENNFQLLEKISHLKLNDEINKCDVHTKDFILKKISKNT